MENVVINNLKITRKKSSLSTKLLFHVAESCIPQCKLSRSPPPWRFFPPPPSFSMPKLADLPAKLGDDRSQRIIRVIDHLVKLGHQRLPLQDFFISKFAQLTEQPVQLVEKRRELLETPTAKGDLALITKGVARQQPLEAPVDRLLGKIFPFVNPQQVAVNWVMVTFTQGPKRVEQNILLKRAALNLLDSILDGTPRLESLLYPDGQALGLPTKLAKRQRRPLLLSEGFDRGENLLANPPELHDVWMNLVLGFIFIRRDIWDLLQESIQPCTELLEAGEQSKNKEKENADENRTPQRLPRQPTLLVPMTQHSFVNRPVVIVELDPELVNRAQIACILRIFPQLTELFGVEKLRRTTGLGLDFAQRKLRDLKLQESLRSIQAIGFGFGFVDCSLLSRNLGVLGDTKLMLDLRVLRRHSQVDPSEKRQHLRDGISPNRHVCIGPGFLVPPRGVNPVPWRESGIDQHHTLLRVIPWQVFPLLPELLRNDRHVDSPITRAEDHDVCGVVQLDEMRFQICRVGHANTIVGSSPHHVHMLAGLEGRHRHSHRHAAEELKTNEEESRQKSLGHGFSFSGYALKNIFG